jgi:hypothetical protein
MNILVIGNGFDKALGLPTSYTDFLDAVQNVKNNRPIRWKENKYDTITDSEAVNEQFEYSLYNRLLYYFFDLCKVKKPSPLWINFEEELKLFLKEIDSMYTETGVLSEDFMVSSNYSDWTENDRKKYTFIVDLFNYGDEIREWAFSLMNLKTDLMTKK